MAAPRACAPLFWYRARNLLLLRTTVLSLSLSSSLETSLLEIKTFHESFRDCCLYEGIVSRINESLRSWIEAKLRHGIAMIERDCGCLCVFVANSRMHRVYGIFSNIERTVFYLFSIILYMTIYYLCIHWPVISVVLHSLQYATHATYFYRDSISAVLTMFVKAWVCINVI